MALARDRKLRTVRDLVSHHLVAAMHAALCDVALKFYGVPAPSLQTYFHCQPQFMRLHAHATCLDRPGPNCLADRAHLLPRVADDLRRDPDYFKLARLCYRLRVGESLHRDLTRFYVDHPVRDDAGSTSLHSGS